MVSPAKGLTIAIDGPAGSGKSTIAQIISRKLNLKCLDTGAMYRGITLAALRDKVSLDEEESLVKIARNANFRFDYKKRYKQPFRVILNGKDVTREIRSKRVTAHVSQVSAYPAVRREMVKKQREMAAEGNVVMEGRDIGSVVLPHAHKKFYLTASIEERAKRRSVDLQRDGYEISQEAIMREIARRDHYDSTRPASPLVVPSDAILIDTTGKSVEEVVNEVLRHLEEPQDNDSFEKR